MGSDNKKGVILYVSIVLVLGLILIFIPQNSFAQSSQCCILDGACSNDLNEQTCIERGGSFSAENCLNVDACTGVCCKLNDQTCEYIIKGACEGIGLMLTGIDEAQCQAAYCAQGDVALLGTVRYSDNSIASGAKVDVTDSAGTTRRVIARDDGSFSIIVRKNQVYDVDVYHKTNSNCNLMNQQANIQNNMVDMGTLTLPCAGTVPACSTVWTVSSWTNVAGECGSRTVTDTGNCNPSTLNNKPIAYKECAQASTCGDKKITGNEECEPGVSLPASTNECSDFEEGSEGTVTCSDNCMILKDCTSCSQCTDDSMCGVCPSCEGVALCETQCTSSDEVEVFTAAPSSRNGVKGITLNWEIPERCALSDVLIYRCDGNNAENPTACNLSADKKPRGLLEIDASGGAGYIDENMDVTKVVSYCYNITFSGADGTSSFAISYPRLVCATVLDDDCVGMENGITCVGKDLVSCTDGNSQITPCSCGCRGATETEEAACVDTSLCDVCDICSGPFGLFAYESKDYDLSDVDPYSGFYGSCSETLLSEGGDGYCYSDDYSANKAIIGQYHACHDISSCYDYRTIASCNSNPCDMESADECKWVSITSNNELGLGVCVPTDVEQQDCTKCNELNILGTYCPPNLCYKFGEDENGLTTCYYNNYTRSEYDNLKIDSNSCMNIKDVACETYDTIETCLGVDEYGAQGSFLLNAQYYDEERISGDNSYISLTKDIFNRGKCTWVENVQIPSRSKCVRDADASLAYSSNPDCSRVDGNEVCFLDFTNPETELVIGDEIFQNGDGEYSKAELLLLSVNVSERVEDTFITELYDCGDSGNIYPNLVYSNAAGRLSDRNTMKASILAASPGDYCISVYSEDSAHNLEFVKPYLFRLLPDLSEEIEVLFSNSSAFYASADKYLSNLTVSVDYEGLECITSLKSNANTAINIVGDARKSSPELVWNYNYLPDGTYTLGIVCADSHLQMFNQSYILTFDVDMSINGAYHKGSTFRAGSVEFGIKTNESAECYYTDDSTAYIPENGQPGAAWTRYQITGGTEHSSTVSESSSGMKYYYSACLFSNTGKWYMWNDGDVVFYAVDEIAPDIFVYDYSGGIYNSSEMKEELSLKIVCVDNDLYFNTSKNYAFGCNDTIWITRYYESQEDNNPIDDPDLPGDLGLPDLPDMPDVGSFGNNEEGETTTISNGGFYDVPAPNSYVKVMLEITAKDKGGNSRTITQFVNVRNLTFMNPIVTICDSELGTCT